MVFTLDESRNVNILHICHIGRFQDGINISGIEQYDIALLDSWMVHTLDESRNVIFFYVCHIGRFKDGINIPGIEEALILHSLILGWYIPWTN